MQRADHRLEKCIEVAAAIECEIACDNGDDGTSSFQLKC